MKNNAKKNLNFYETYTLDKQYKLHSKESLIDTTDEFAVRLNIDLLGRGNTLSDIRSYRYKAILMDKATHMRFSMTIKSKFAVCDKSKIIFGEIEKLIRRKM